MEGGEDFDQFLKKDILRVLPHQDEDTVQSIVELLITQGVKKARDLRHITVQILQTDLNFIDASELQTEWQNKYGNTPTTSGSHQSQASTSNRRALTERQQNMSEAVLFGMPDFDKDSPFMPAGVKAAILDKKRPTPREREDMVQRIVDHCREVVPNLQRHMFNSVADSLVSQYPDSFKDTLRVDNLGSHSLRSQLKNKYDNDKRPNKPSLCEKESPSHPLAYGCISWNPKLPEGETEDSQNTKRKILQDIHKLSSKHWDWKTVKSHMETTYYLQRKDINGTINTGTKKRKRSEGDEDADQPSPVTVIKLKEDWPFLFKARGLNYHFKLLTGVDFRERFSTFIRKEGKVFIEFLACKEEELAKLRRKMLRAEERSYRETLTKALLQMIPKYFGEELKHLVVFVEETTDSIEAAHTAAVYPEDGTPNLIAAGKNLFSANLFFLTIDQQIVSTTRSIEDAFTLLFSSYFVLNLKYCANLSCTLSFVQKAIAEINPEKGTKIIGKHATLRSINQKVLRLSNKYAEYQQKMDEEDNEENV